MAWKSIPILLSILCLLLVSSHGRKLQSEVSNVTKLVRATNPKDVQGVGAITRQFPELKNNLYKGSDVYDPCLPIWWTWVSCNNDTIAPRVTALHLSNRNLIGPIPDFRTMDALQRIYMYNNSLTGTIPSFLGTLPNLQTLYLFNNLLSGSIPASIALNKKLTTGFYGNPLLIQIPPPSPTYFTTLPYIPSPRDQETRSVRVRVKFRPLKLIILGVVIAAVIVFFCLSAVLGALCGCGRKTAETAEPVEAAESANTGEEDREAVSQSQRISSPHRQ